MILYAESSAVAAWLFGQPSGREVGQILGSARTIATSELTLLECHRAISRREFEGAISRDDAEGLRRDLSDVSAHWMISTISSEITIAASRRFPVEPIRSLDAIHLATIVRTKAAIPELVTLTMDHRVRQNALALGIEVVPATEQASE